MNPLIITVALPELNFRCRVGPADASAAGPEPSLPELQVLNHYCGAWDDEIAGPTSLNRTEIGEWVLDGRFLRQSWICEASDGIPTASGVTMMTYDPASACYLSWSFLAIGSVVHNRGEWDSATQTMTWVDRLSGEGEIVTTKAQFIGNVSYSWSIVKHDKAGRILREVKGTSIRRRV
jgi:hypothetical protein